MKFTSALFYYVVIKILLKKLLKSACVENANGFSGNKQQTLIFYGHYVAMSWVSFTALKIVLMASLVWLYITHFPKRKKSLRWYGGQVRMLPRVETYPSICHQSGHHCIMQAFYNFQLFLLDSFLFMIEICKIQIPIF